MTPCQLLRFFSGYLLLPLCAIAIMGCNGAHLYNASEDALARSAQTSFNDAKLADSLKGERDLLNQMQTRDLDVVRRHTLARRDLELISLLLPAEGTSPPPAHGPDPASVGGFRKQILDRMNTLAGGPENGPGHIGPSEVETVAKGLAGSANALPGDQQRLALQAQSCRAHYLSYLPNEPAPDLSKPPDASALSAKGLDPVKIAVISEDYATYLDYKTTYENHLATITGWKYGEFAQIARRVQAIQDSQAQVAARITELNTQYDATKKEYDAEVAKAKPEDVATLAKQLQAKLDEIGNTADVAKAQQLLEQEHLGSLGLTGTIAMLEQQKKNVDEVLAAMTGDKGAPKPDPSKANSTLLRVATAFPEAYKELTAGDTYPKVGVLLLQSNRLRLEIDAENQRKTAAGNVVDLFVGKRDAQLQEFVMLNQMWSDLDALQVNDDTRILTVLRGNDFQRQTLSDALLLYGDSWTVFRVAEEQADYAVIDARVTATLDDSEAALAQWQNLISEPLSQLAALHAAGIKPEDIANLIHAAGFGAIGYGVNK